MGTLDEAVAKYGGADEAYKLKLKTKFRDLLGYSNYMSRIGQETAAPADIGSVEGLSPAGVNARISSRFNTQNANVDALASNASAIDTAAGSIADKLAAKNKAADKYRYDSSFIFQPKDSLDQKILDYARNPRNEDGSIKTAEQFEKELNDEFGAGLLGPGAEQGIAGGGATPEYSLEDVRNRLTERLPADYVGKEDSYSYRFQGMTEKQAAEEQIINYANMIVAGQGDKVPPELYPVAYHLLSDTEKAKLRGLKSERGNSLEGL